MPPAASTTQPAMGPAQTGFSPQGVSLKHKKAIYSSVNYYGTSQSFHLLNFTAKVWYRTPTITPGDKASLKVNLASIPNLCLPQFGYGATSLPSRLVCQNKGQCQSDLQQSIKLQHPNTPIL